MNRSVAIVLGVLLSSGCVSSNSTLLMGHVPIPRASQQTTANCDLNCYLDLSTSFEKFLNGYIKEGKSSYKTNRAWDAGSVITSAVVGLGVGLTSALMSSSSSDKDHKNQAVLATSGSLIAGFLSAISQALHFSSDASTADKCRSAAQAALDQFTIAYPAGALGIPKTDADWLTYRAVMDKSQQTVTGTCADVH